MAAKKTKKQKYYLKNKSTSGMVAQRWVLISVGLLLVLMALFGVYKLLAFTGSLFFSRNPSFELTRIEMNSDGRLTPGMLEGFAQIERGMNLFEIKFDALRDRLESYPMIESVRMKRQLPDTLVVDVVERVAVAQVHWRWRAPPILIDRYGFVLQPTSTGRALPIIEGYKTDLLLPGEKIDDPGIHYVLDLLSASDFLQEPGFQVAFERFNLRYPDYIDVTLENGVSARFPRHSPKSKLRRLADTLAKARETGRKIKTVDLVPDGVNTPTY
ncbi:MAG: FtsQ-type POTRA domain-containing protein [Kiritimatiellaceae bacterium]|nr:FtsQ-type POTRA domain-containing protein [Kiritimatiellaceae bacterium]